MTLGFAQPDPQVLDDLRNIVGENGWKPGTDQSRFYDDPRGRFSGKGCLILLPTSTEQVAAIITRCNAAKVGVIPVSGGTGVVAGQLSIESENAIILSLERMNRVREGFGR